MLERVWQNGKLRWKIGTFEKESNGGIPRIQLPLPNKDQTKQLDKHLKKLLLNLRLQRQRQRQWVDPVDPHNSSHGQGKSDPEAPKRRSKQGNAKKLLFAAGRVQRNVMYRYLYGGLHFLSHCWIFFFWRLLDLLSCEAMSIF
jgi:hypothetical protein